MILRRIATGIKNQDWFVVLVELLIVVVGIYIGLQVDDWNKEREDRQLEIRYLERLDADLAQDFESISGAISAGRLRIDRAYFLLQAAENEALIYNDPTYFIESIEYAGYTYNPVIADHTFEEIKSSGRLLIIRNEALRSNLAAFYNHIQNRGQFNFIRQDFQLKYMELEFGLLTAEQQINMALDQSHEYSAVEAKAVYGRMMKKPEFMAWLPKVIQSKERTEVFMRLFLERIKTLRAEIAEELGNEENE